MALFNFPWLRKFIRKHSSPIPEERAHFWKRRISFAYAIIAWNTFGFVCYQIYCGKADWAEKYKSEEELKSTPAQQWSRILRVKDATVYRVSGLNVSKYEIHNNFDEDKETNVDGNEAIDK